VQGPQVRLRRWLPRKEPVSGLRQLRGVSGLHGPLRRLGPHPDRVVR
jgi:hypothetical protein